MSEQYKSDIDKAIEAATQITVSAISTNATFPTNDISGKEISDFFDIVFNKIRKLQEV